MILHVDAQTAHRLIDGTQTAITVPVTWQNSIVNGERTRDKQRAWKFFPWRHVHQEFVGRGVPAFVIAAINPDLDDIVITPLSRPRDEILFTEPWCGGQHGSAIQYKAEWRDGEYGPQWRSPYHMPREAIRLKRTLVSVRGVWPKELTEEEIEDEGLERGTYCDCPTDPPGYGHRPLCECSDSSLKQAFHDYYIAKHCGMWDHPAWRYEVKG